LGVWLLVFKAGTWKWFSADLAERLTSDIIAFQIGLLVEVFLYR
jgi:hypothetical protein